MANRLKTLLFVFVLSVGVFSGTPIQGGDMGMRKNVCPMKCCKKSANTRKPKKANDAKFLCRVLVCSQNMPTNTTSASQANFAPVLVASEKTNLFEILFSKTPKEIVQPTSISAIPTSTSQPKYIQHHRILV